MNKKIKVILISTVTIILVVILTNLFFGNYITHFTSWKWKHMYKVCSLELAEDIVERKLLDGKNKTEVAEMLNGPHKKEYFERNDWGYMVTSKFRFYFGFYDLHVDFDENGIVEKYYVNLD